MPDWLVECGIGESRAALIEGHEIVEARIELEGEVPAGTVLKARLVNVGVNGRNAIAVAEAGAEYLLPRGAPALTEGASLTIEVTRARIPGSEPWKLPLARISEKNPNHAPRLSDLGSGVLVARGVKDSLGDAGWNDLLEQGRSGLIGFAGGELRVTATPAMTLIDVDGYLAPAELSVVGAREAARAIRRLDIGGSIGVDLPTAGSKSARQAAAQAIDEVLPQPFERTAVNGFGLVQIVRPRTRASLLELASDRAPFEARALLRRASFEPAGSKILVAHPAVVTVLEQKPDWLERLSRQLGGLTRLRADPALPISGGYAEPA